MGVVCARFSANDLKKDICTSSTKRNIIIPFTVLFSFDFQCGRKCEAAQQMQIKIIINGV